MKHRQQLYNIERKSGEEKNPANAVNEFGFFPSLQTICFEKLFENESLLAKDMSHLFGSHEILRNQYFEFKKEKTKEIAENLLQHKHIDAMLALLGKHSDLLKITVRATGWGGFCYEGTILQMVAMAGEFDLREPIKEKKEKPVGLVNLLQPLFNAQNEFQAQLAAVFPENHQVSTQERMAIVRKAIQDLVSETINSEDIPNNRNINADEFEQLIINLEIAQKFRKAIKPTYDPNNSDAHVIRQGFAWDTSIFAEFIELFKGDFQGRLGGLWSNKSDFVDTVVWSALQAQSPLADLQVFSKGICNVIDYDNATCKQLPVRLELSKQSDAERLNCVGVSHFFGYFGANYQSRDAEAPARGGWWGRGIDGLGNGAAIVRVSADLFKFYVNQKQQLCKTCAPTRPKARHCLLM